jgi:hypothetical protein
MLRVDKLQLVSGKLRLTARVGATLTGAITVTVKAGSKSERFEVTPSASGTIKLTRKLTALGNAESATVTLEYAGDAGTRALTLRLIAARAAAKLGKPVARVSKGKLQLSGNVDKRAKGTVSVQVEYVTAANTVKTLTVKARIKRGRWSAQIAVPKDAAPGRSLSISAVYAGSAPRNLQGGLTVTTAQV